MPIAAKRSPISATAELLLGVLITLVSLVASRKSTHAAQHYFAADKQGL